jgi:hypothetical protein
MLPEEGDAFVALHILTIDLTINATENSKRSPDGAAAKSGIGV